MILNRLKKRYPDIATALDYVDPWQLLVATVLSAQTTDEMVNKVTPVLFSRWPEPEDLAAANPEDVEDVVYSTGFYRQKTKSIMGLAQAVVEMDDGRVPAVCYQITPRARAFDYEGDGEWDEVFLTGVGTSANFWKDIGDTFNAGRLLSGLYDQEGYNDNVAAVI